MSRLQEFITRIRNAKTQAEERAEYQKQMAAIRESFGKNQETMRPRNVTKLLFINMSGQQTNFGQMECLKLITGNTFIQKRIGYLGLTQLFHEKSELLLMATNRIKVDLAHNNKNLVALALCVLSQICTPELAIQLHKQVLNCIKSQNKSVKKKAILTSIKLIKKAPQFAKEFVNAVFEQLKDKNNGVLLGIFAFLQNSFMLEQIIKHSIINKMNVIKNIYYSIVNETNTDYQVNGAKDPFLQVAILRLLRLVKNQLTNNDHRLKDYLTVYGQILVISHDAVCAKITAGTTIKGGSNAVLYQCFQCLMTIPANPTLNTYTESVLSKFVSIKDANSKYLSLFNLGLMAKHEIQMARKYKNTIVQCLDEDDNLIRVMALDLLYLIASPENVAALIKELLNVLLSASDEEFIPELSLKICLIVDKFSQDRRWHFDTILKVLILADTTVKEESAKSLVHLISSTPELQQYCLTKLFFSSCQNLKNDTLCKVTMYLLGEFSGVLLRVPQIEVKQENIVDLIEQILFRSGAKAETIQYGLSSLFKLYDKFASQQQKILLMIKSFQRNSNLQVQKRACEYVRLLDISWRDERLRQINIPVPPMRSVSETFANIPIGDTQMDLSNQNLTLPQKLSIRYEDYIVDDENAERSNRPYRQTGQSQGNILGQGSSPNIIPKQETQVQPQITTKPSNTKKFSLLDDDDDVPVQTTQQPAQQPQPQQTQSQKTDPFDFLGLDVGPSVQPQQQPPQQNGDIFGFSLNNQPQTVAQINRGNSNSGGLLDGGFLGLSQPQTQSPQQQFVPPPQNNGIGFDFLGGSNPVQQQPQPQLFQTPQQQPQQQQQFSQQPPVAQQNNSFKFKAYETEHIQIWMQCMKQGDGSTQVHTKFNNKTLAYIEALTLQTAVMKYLKIVTQPMSGTSLPPSSKGAATINMTITNSSIGEKPIVMKIKLGYVINGQKVAYEQKIQGFPLGY